VNALTLYRVDPARRMRRFYLIDVRPDLFGQWSLIRELRPHRQPGQMRIATCPNEDEARTGLGRYCRAKQQRGYRRTSGSGTAPF
jgi:predicted DNA-binding WGR domain protein